MKRAVAMIVGVLVLGSCNVHDSSIAESTLAGRYYLGWSDNGTAAEVLLEIESPDPANMTGVYTFEYGSSTPSSGTVTGTKTDSIRLTFKSEFGGGSFRGLALDNATLQGRLVAFHPGGSIARTVTLYKSKYQY